MARDEPHACQLHEHTHACLVPPAAPEPTPDDAARIDAVLRALARLRRLDPFPLAQGLSPANAAACLGVAAGGLTRDGLARALATPGRRPASLALVVAHGVFTSPLEWACLYAAAGIDLHVKAPSRDPAFCLALARVLQDEGLPVRASTTRDLGRPEAVVAMGDDASVAAVARATPHARHALFGHRFSAVLVDEPAPVAQALAWDTAYYDTRGCMAPAAVFVVGDPDPLMDALAPAMEQVEAILPRGRVDPALGPEWRRRLGLARARGRAVEGQRWALARLPLEHFVPVALPRLLTFYAVEGPLGVVRTLEPWREHLSVVCTDDALRPLRDERWKPVFEWFPRYCAPGQLQRPPFPRLHDGLSMLGAVLGPEAP